MATSAIETLPGMTFGCDPEFFVLNSEGEPVSVEDFLPGTKAEPYKVDCGAVQVDGMAAEFNIDPVDNYQDFHNNIATVVNELKKFLPSGHTLSPSAKAQFSKEQWDKASLNAKMLGCSPDFNAWEEAINPPASTKKHRTRYAGGHLHIGWREGGPDDDPEHYRACIDLVKQLDWYLGGWSVTRDKDVERRKMYGKAGSMRFKPYGAEYRVLSNFWLSSSYKKPSIAMTKEIWNRMQKALWAMSEGACLYSSDYSAKFNNTLIQTINTGNRDSYLENNFYFPIVGLDM